jgi:glycosyltransferase involved in cell wall biosynthesis
MEKIQIVHFVETLEKGGLENVIYNIATNLDDKKFDVSVVCRIKGGHTAERLMESGKEVAILNLRHLPLMKINKILQKFKRNKMAILHCHGLFATSTEAIIGSFCDYNSIFVHVHNLEKPHLVWQSLKLKILQNRVHKFIAVSQSVSNCMQKFNINNIITVPNSISTAKFKYNALSGSDKFGFSSKNFLLGMIGRIEKRKGFQQFLDIIEKSNSINGLIVGEGTYESEVKSMVLNKNLYDKIKFLPFQSQDRLPDIYAKLDGLFLFSTKEGLPLALLESQACGVPYIGNSIGGIKEVIKNGYNGFLIDDIDVAQVSDITSQIMENPEFYRKNAREIIEHKYSHQKRIAEFEKLYLESVY